jgi:hypothetical protein
MKRNLLPLMFFAAFALLAIAIVVDCVRLADDARARVQLADQELQKHEDRLAVLLAASPAATPEVQDAITNFRAAQDPQSRRDAYQAMVSTFQQTMAGQLDATNPIARKFMDDTAGAINRHQVAEKPYDEEQSAYQKYLASWRGQIAQWFSSIARADRIRAEVAD